MLLSAGAFAQTSNSIPTNYGPTLHPVTKVLNMKSQRNHDEKSIAPFWIDYDYADFFNDSVNAGTYTRYYGYMLNRNFVLADTVAPLYQYYTYVTVAFDSIVDSYNSGGPLPYDHRDYESYTIDSLSANVGQMNLSGTDDTVLIQILSVDTISGQNFRTGYPTHTVLWSDTAIIPATSPLGADYSDIVSLVWAPNLVVNHGKFAVKLTYFGNTQDSFTFVNGFPSFIGTGICNGYVLADSSSYYPNSYTYVANKYLQGNYPDSVGSFYYNICNSTPNTFAYGVDGFMQIQNAAIFAKVDLGSTGIQQNKALGIKLFQNVPNPTNGTSLIAYQLAKGGNVSMNITDIAGRTVKSFDEGMMDAGKHYITIDSKDIAQGIYFYTLNVDGVILTNKMVVNK
jgi:hypothetical protein